MLYKNHITKVERFGKVRFIGWIGISSSLSKRRNAYGKKKTENFRENYEEVAKMGEAEFWEELHYCTMEKELREEGIREGIKEGISQLIIACKELGVSREKTLEQLGKRYQLDEEAAEQSMAEYW